MLCLVPARPPWDAHPTSREFARVLREGGHLFCAVKRGEGTRRGGGYAGDDRHFTLYDRGELRALAGDAGVAVESLRLDAGDGETGSEGWLQLLARAE